MSKRDINSSIFAALKVSEKSNVPFLLIGNPGAGKTTTVEMFAKIRGYQMILVRGSQSTPEEILGYEVSDPQISKTTTVRLRPAWFENLLNLNAEGKKCLLFLDEITTANEYTQSALLHLIFERKVGDEKLPDDTLIVSAGNYASNLSSQFNLIPPLLNRFCIYNITPEESDLENFLSKYKGVSVNKRLMGLDPMMKTLKEMDNLEVSVTDDFLYSIAEKIELTILLTTKALSKQGKLNLKVTDMQDLYGDLSNDMELPGFTTLRSLNYFRDIAIASYKCFGKAGLTSDNFKTMIYGTVGVGLSRNKINGEVVKNSNTDIYFDAMRKVGDEIDRMMTTSLPKYEEAIKSVIKELGSPDVVMSIEGMTSLMSVLDSVENDREASKIETPIDPQIIKRLSDCLVATSRSSSVSNMDKSKLNSMTADNINGNIQKYNASVKLLNKLRKFVSGKSKNYDSDTNEYLNQAKSIISKNEFKLKVQAGYVKKNLPDGVILQIESVN